MGGARHLARWVTQPVVRRAFFTHHADFDFADPEAGFELARSESAVLEAWHERAAAGQPPS